MIPKDELANWRSRNFSTFYPCPYCDGTFLTIRTLTQHVVANHAPLVDEQRSGTGRFYQQIDTDANPVPDPCPSQETWDETVEAWLGFTCESAEKEESGRTQ